MDLSPIATAEELRAATEYFAAKLQERPREPAERCADWIDWLRRRAGKLFKDAAAAGRWSVDLDPPFQPHDAEQVAALRGFVRTLKPLFPGCRISICEEEAELEGGTGGTASKHPADAPRYTIEIAWRPKSN